MPHIKYKPTTKIKKLLLGIRDDKKKPDNKKPAPKKK